MAAELPPVKVQLQSVLQYTEVLWSKILEINNGSLDHIEIARAASDVRAQLKVAMDSSGVMFENNMQCLTHILALQKEKATSAIEHNREIEELQGRIASLIDVIASLQNQVESSASLLQLKDLWGKVLTAHRSHDSEALPIVEGRDASKALALLSVLFINEVSLPDAEHGKSIIHHLLQKVTEVEGLVSGQTKKLQDENHKLRKKLQGRSAKLHEANSTLTVLQKENAEARHANDKLSAENRSMEARMAALESENASLRVALTEVASSLKHSQLSYDSMHHQYEAAVGITEQWKSTCEYYQQICQQHGYLSTQLKAEQLPSSTIATASMNVYQTPLHPSDNTSSAAVANPDVVAPLSKFLVDQNPLLSPRQHRFPRSTTAVTNNDNDSDGDDKDMLSGIGDVDDDDDELEVEFMYEEDKSLDDRRLDDNQKQHQRQRNNSRTYSIDSCDPPPPPAENDVNALITAETATATAAADDDDDYYNDNDGDFLANDEYFASKPLRNESRENRNLLTPSPMTDRSAMTTVSQHRPSQRPSGNVSSKTMAIIAPTKYEMKIKAGGFISNATKKALERKEKQQPAQSLSKLSHHPRHSLTGYRTGTPNGAVRAKRVSDNDNEYDQDNDEGDLARREISLRGDMSMNSSMERDVAAAVAMINAMMPWDD